MVRGRQEGRVQGGVEGGGHGVAPITFRMQNGRVVDWSTWGRLTREELEKCLVDAVEKIVVLEGMLGDSDSNGSMEG